MSEDAARALLRREILDDVGALTLEHLAGDHWSRLLVTVVAGPGGEPAVADVEVEGIHGDESAVDAAFSGAEVRALLPVLAKATEALCGIDGVELADVEGGTFLRQPSGALEWLPGLLRMPSPALARAWDEVTRALSTKRRALEAAHGISTCAVEIDLAREHLAWTRGGVVQARARATLVGTLASATRTWGWGGTSPHLPESMRRASAAVVDAIAERDLWELSAPVFPLDEGTARALAAFVCDRVGGDGLHEIEDEAGRVFVLLRNVRGAAQTG